MGFDVSILGFGDNVVDRYEHLGVMYPGGNAVNVAVYGRRLGAARSAYMGIFGTDEAAEHVIGSLVDEGVELVRCRQELGENGASSVTVEAGERVFLGSNQGGIRGRRVMCSIALLSNTCEVSMCCIPAAIASQSASCRWCAQQACR